MVKVPLVTYLPAALADLSIGRNLLPRETYTLTFKHGAIKLTKPVVN